tara:strand:- start:7 stop:657 length:651 start_codon:yes stop_codon:yes gene_type:complete
MVFALTVLGVRFGLWAAGVRIRVHGLDHLDDGRNYLFMPNHTSNVDPPVVVTALGRNVSMMGKESLFRIPVLGWMIRFVGFVPISREDRASAIDSVDQATKLLQQGLDFVIFPEGTRSRDGKILPLKKGPFFMAQQGGVPVVPVRIRGTQDVMPKGGRVIHSGVVDVEVCAPIEVTSLDGNNESIRGQLRARVKKVLEDDLTHSEGCVTPQCNERS